MINCESSYHPVANDLFPQVWTYCRG